MCIELLVGARPVVFHIPILNSPVVFPAFADDAKNDGD